MSEPRLHEVDLVATTSHEMRTPLAAIRGFTETLRQRRHELSDDEVEEFLTVIAQQTDRLTRMVDDLLAMSRLETGTMPIDPETVLLVPLLEDLVSMLGEDADRVRIRVTTELPASMEVDPLRLRQVLTNLLQNALRFSGPNEPVALVADHSPDEVVFEVIDHGPGIALSEQERIFEPFYRVPGGGGDDGAGLGLAITRRLVAAMGGRATVTSSPGEGSAFRVTLPQRAHRGPVPPSSAA